MLENYFYSLLNLVLNKLECLSQVNCIRLVKHFVTWCINVHNCSQTSDLAKMFVVVTIKKGKKKFYKVVLKNVILGSDIIFNLLTIASFFILSYYSALQSSWCRDISSTRHLVDRHILFKLIETGKVTIVDVMGAKLGNLLGEKSQRHSS